MDDEYLTYAVAAVDSPVRDYPSSLVVFARLVKGTIVIEEDATDKPLLDALLQRGVPRNQIILAYAGEKQTA